MSEFKFVIFLFAWLVILMCIPANVVFIVRAVENTDLVTIFLSSSLLYKSVDFAFYGYNLLQSDLDNTKH